MANSVETQLRAANRHAEKGNNGTAAKLLSDIVHRYPGNRKARVALAALWSRSVLPDIDAKLESKRFSDVIENLAPLIAEQPRSVALLRRLAMALMGLGRHRDACDIWKAAALEAPEDVEILLGSGSAACLSGQHRDGIGYFRKAIASGAGDRGHLTLGYAHLSLGEFHTAIQTFLNAKGTTRCADIDFGLGEAYHALGDLVAAAAAYGRVLVSAPRNVQALGNLGMVRLDLGDAKGAIEMFESVLAQRPQDEGAQENLAIAMLAMGDVNDAAEQRRSLLARSGGAFGCARSFVPQARDDELGDLSARFTRALEARPEPNMNKVDALYGLAEIEIRKGNPLAAVARLDAAGNVYKHLATGDQRRHLRTFETIKNCFSRSAPVVEYSPVPFTPIFIVGMPRSGTTLMEQMLTSHPDVAGVGESEALPLAIDRSGGLDTPLTQNRVSEIRARYLEEIAARGVAKHRMVTDKMPQNFRYIGVIAAALPEAKIVHMTRRAEAVCWSCYRARFQAVGLDFTFDQTSLGRYYSGYRALMSFWHETLPGRILDQSYEALTEAPEAQARRLLSKLGLQWHPSVLASENNARAVRTASALQVRRKIYQGSSEKWKVFAGGLVPLLTELGRDAPEAGISEIES